MSEKDRALIQLVDWMKTQKELYGAMLDLAEKLNDQLDHVEDPQIVFPIIVEREEVMERISKVDEEISSHLKKPGLEKALEAKEPAKIVEQLKTLIKKIMEADERGREKIDNAKGSIRDEFRSITKTRKSMSGYSYSKKPVYAKFIDIRK